MTSYSSQWQDYKRRGGPAPGTPPDPNQLRPGGTPHESGRYPGGGWYNGTFQSNQLDAYGQPQWSFGQGTGPSGSLMDHLLMAGGFRRNLNRPEYGYGRPGAQAAQAGQMGDPGGGPYQPGPGGPPGSVWNQQDKPGRFTPPYRTYQDWGGVDGQMPGGNANLLYPGADRTQAWWDVFFPGTGAAPRAADDVQGKPDMQFGTAFSYPDTFGQVLLQMQQQGMRGQAGPAGMLEQMMRNYQGKPEDFGNQLKLAGPALALSMMNTPAYKATQDYQQLLGREAEMGAASGQIADTTARQLQAGQEALGSAGLGRSAAMSSLAQQAAQSQGTAQASVGAQIRQAQLAQQLSAAQTAMDQNRMITQMAFNQNPGSRVPDSSGLGYGQLGGAVGGGIGTIIGALFGGVGAPVGGAIGSAAGTAAGGAVDHSAEPARFGW